MSTATQMIFYKYNLKQEVEKFIEANPDKKRGIWTRLSDACERDRSFATRIAKIEKTEKACATTDQIQKMAEVLELMDWTTLIND